MRPGGNSRPAEPVDMRTIHQKMMVRLDLRHPRECLDFTWPEIEMVLELPPRGMSDVEIKPHGGRGVPQTEEEIVKRLAQRRRMTPKQKLLRAMEEHGG